MDKMREEFEAWARACNAAKKRRYIDLRKSVNGLYYMENTTEVAWQSWQASRKALVVTLPKVYDDDYGGHMGAPDVEVALEDAGVSYE